jgi:uncharacterized iron-regulated protein
MGYSTDRPQEAQLRMMGRLPRRRIFGLGLAISTWLVACPVQAQTTPAPPRFQSANGEAIAFPDLIAALAPADVVYLGEIHDSPDDHAAQLAILQALYVQNPHLAIGLEMFQRPYQPALDAYVAGDISLTELRQRTEYDDRWGYPWHYYAPILEFARRQGLPLIALNAPTEAVRLVGRKGLGALQPEEFPTVPPAPEMDRGRGPYRDLLRRLYDSFHQGHGSNAGFEFFFQAQVLWDETMADRIAQFHRDYPDTQLVVLTGQGHVIYRYGIPSGVSRRQPTARQVTVLLSPPSAWMEIGEETAAIADFVSTDTSSSLR